MSTPRQVPIVFDARTHAEHEEQLRLELEAQRAENEALRKRIEELTWELEDAREELEIRNRVSARRRRGDDSEPQPSPNEINGLTVVDRRVLLYQLIREGRAFLRGAPVHPERFPPGVSTAVAVIVKIDRGKGMVVRVARAILTAIEQFDLQASKALQKHPHRLLEALVAKHRGQEFQAAMVQIISAAGLGDVTFETLRTACKRKGIS